MSGKLTLISSATASGSSSVSFTSGIDSTYDEYVFYFVDLFPSVSGQNFGFQVNASGGSGFNETITSTFFDADNLESGSGGTLQYETGDDQAQSTAYQRLTRATGGDADATCAGVLHLFNPASTTYVKHFYGRFNEYFSASPRTLDNFIAGYINNTTAITEIDFKFFTGTITGNIYLYGVG
jgi:hypothetical protein